MIHGNRALGVTIAAVLLLTACRADLGGLQTLSVEELAAWQGARSDFAVYDANAADTRERFGVIPGATLLTSYRDYAPAAELGADLERTRVFYCHSARCGAAADAARKALASGYRDVWVLEPGITGWADAGLPVVTPTGEERTS